MVAHEQHPDVNHRSDICRAFLEFHAAMLIISSNTSQVGCLHSAECSAFLFIHEQDPAVRAGASRQQNYGGGAFYTTDPGSAPTAMNRLSPLPPEPVDFGSATVDIPLDSGKDLKKKERELQAKEAELKRRAQELKRREDAAARAGIVIEERNWLPFFPLIHHDIANEIPIHLQRLQYFAFASFLDFLLTSGILPAIDLMSPHVIIGILYFVGFALFCLESLLSIWVIQQVYMYFRGSGKAAEMKREAAL
ncbi:secretory carrier-associated membrane protein 1-like [Nymphaea colorata]|nr:secretory carrier-associated membrane protein 1-like [Nymphaea colorata]